MPGARARLARCEFVPATSRNGRAGYDPVLLDLDGTVIDSVALIRESHRHAVRAVLGRELPDEALVANVGRPLIDQMRLFSDERAEDLLAAYRDWNHAHTAELLRPYAEIADVLGQLRADGRRLGIVTSKSHPVVELAWAVLPELRELFDAVVAAEDTERHKPEPDPVLHALELLGASPAGACYVGDSPFDLGAGRAAGVATIAVTWGFFGRQELEAEGPDLIVETPAELLAACRHGVPT
jgi:pyrophosphatase PpaX